MAKKTSKKKSAKVKVVDRKKDQKKTPPPAESETKKSGPGIETKCRVGKITVKPKCVVVDFKDMDFRADEIRRMSIWTKEDEPLVVTIDEIASKGKIKKCITTAGGSEVVLHELNYSAKYCEKLITIVKSEAEITIKFVAETGNLYEGLVDEGETVRKPEEGSN